jgi:hypothetical protein
MVSRENQLGVTQAMCRGSKGESASFIAAAMDAVQPTATWNRPGKHVKLWRMAYNLQRGGQGSVRLWIGGERAITEEAKRHAWTRVDCSRPHAAVASGHQDHVLLRP